jgi:protein-disulfide isomerase
MYPTVKELKETYKDKLTFVFRNLPLTNIHPNALAAAVAAEAAGQQNKFWEMHDKLYENQPAWQSAAVEERGRIFETYAQQLGLNVGQFTQDLSSPAVTEKINRDRATAQKLNASSTPTFVLNGQLLPEQVSVNGDELKKTVEQALRDAGHDLQQ